ncbi:hypothetical protein O6H91_06G027900 [Diphasiastrum complanatum]|nr:hypothetical protein O6H91_06G027900 [Diphasiastrum complanatum]
MHKVSLTSSTYGFLQTEVDEDSMSGKEKCNPSLEKNILNTEETDDHDSMSGNEKCYPSLEKSILNTEETDDISPSENPFVTKLRVRKATDPLFLSDEVTEVINVRELMEGLEDNVLFSLKSRTRKKSKGKGHRRSFSSSHVQTLRKLKELPQKLVEIPTKPRAVYPPGLSTSASEKKGSLTYAEQLCSRCACCENEQIRRPETVFSHSNSTSVLENKEVKFFYRESKPLFKGYSAVSLTDRHIQFAKTYIAVPFTISSTKNELLEESELAEVEYQPDKSRSQESGLDLVSSLPVITIMPEIMTRAHKRSPTEFPTEYREGSRSPIFDPVILDAVEKALLNQHVLIDNWCHVRSDGEVESNQKLEILRDMPFSCSTRSEFEAISSEEKLAKNVADVFGLRYPEIIDKEMCTDSSIEPESFAAAANNKARTKQIEDFELRCPPEGEDRVVLYVTSLRTIRKTYEDCNYIKSTLQTFNVKVDERDVSIHSEFKRELRDLLNNPLPVPRLFIKGRYIGGVEEFLQLNEDDAMPKLLEGVPAETNSGKICEGCGGFRFIPCTECNGSCKIVRGNESKVRCTDCNENGLIRCQLCY